MESGLYLLFIQYLYNIGMRLEIQIPVIQLIHIL